MTLSDFDISDCPGGVYQVRFAPHAPPNWIENEIRFIQSAFSLRRGKLYDLGTESLWRARLEPLASILGVPPGLVLISPMLQRWA